MMSTESSLDSLLQHLKREAESAGVFGPVTLREGMLVCQAKASAAPSSYRVSGEGGRVWVALVMADRWLSGSIETDLLHTGDKMEDLLEEELVELGYSGSRPVIEHFRSEDLLFTFRTPVPPSGSEAEQRDLTAKFLLAYEACFRRLGDMEAGDEED